MEKIKSWWYQIYIGDRVALILSLIGIAVIIANYIVIKRKSKDDNSKKR